MKNDLVDYILVTLILLFFSTLFWFDDVWKWWNWWQ